MFSSIEFNELRRGKGDSVLIDADTLPALKFDCLLYLSLNIDSTLAAAIMSISAENEHVFIQEVRSGEVEKYAGYHLVYDLVV